MTQAMSRGADVELEDDAASATTLLIDRQQVRKYRAADAAIGTESAAAEPSARFRKADTGESFLAVVLRISADGSSEVVSATEMRI